jgi:hypothetical protein
MWTENSPAERDYSYTDSNGQEWQFKITQGNGNRLGQLFKKVDGSFQAYGGQTAAPDDSFFKTMFTGIGALLPG